MAPVHLYDAEHSGQAQPGSFGKCLSCKEWLKNVLQHVLVHTVPCVRNCEENILTGRQFSVIPTLLFIESHIVRPDGEFSTIGHGVFRVDRQVYEHLLDLGPICPNRTQVLLQLPVIVDDEEEGEEG